MLRRIRRTSSQAGLRLHLTIRKLYYACLVSFRRFRSRELEFGMFSAWIRKGSWVIDVGANVGLYAYQMSRLVGRTGRVLAFEPLHENFELLVMNVAHFSFRNVTLLQVALSDEWIESAISTPIGKDDALLFARSKLSDGPELSHVVYIPLDVLRVPHRIRLIKIDAEEYESAVIKGMMRTVRRDRPFLIVESLSRDIERWLESLGTGFQRLGIHQIRPAYLAGGQIIAQT